MDSTRSKPSLPSQSPIDDERQQAEEAALSLSSREVGIVPTTRPMSARREATFVSPTPRGGMAKSSSFSSLSPTAGFMRRYCFFGILLSLVVLVVHLAETSSILERSMLVLTGTPSSEGSSLASASSSPHKSHKTAASKQVERKEQSKRLRSSRTESADETVEKQCTRNVLMTVDSRCDIPMGPSHSLFFAFH